MMAYLLQLTFVSYFEFLVQHKELVFGLAVQVDAVGKCFHLQISDLGQIG